MTTLEITVGTLPSSLNVYPATGGQDHKQLMTDGM